jgi:hypothetical protein
MYSYKDIETGKIHQTRGVFAGWHGPTGLLQAYYAQFQNPRGSLFIPVYLLTRETQQTLPIPLAANENDYCSEGDPNVYPFDTVVEYGSPIALQLIEPLHKFIISRRADGSAHMVARQFINGIWEARRFFDSADPYQNYTAAKAWIREHYPNSVIYGEPYPEPDTEQPPGRQRPIIPTK